MFEEFVTLKGKTRHGKNRINQHGTRWRVKSHGTFRGSPALSITSLDKTEGPRDKKQSLKPRKKSFGKRQ